MKTTLFLSITFFFTLHGYAQNDPAKKSSSIVQPKIIHQNKNSAVVQDIETGNVKSKTTFASESKLSESIDRKKVLTDNQGVQSLSAPESSTKKKNDDTKSK